MASCGCGWLSRLNKRITPAMQLYIVLVILMVLGVVEYGVNTAENYIIARKSQTAELIYQYSNNILGVFMSVFTFVNLVFTTTMSFKDAKPGEEGKQKNMSKLFHFGIAFGLVSGLLIMCLLLFLRVELFTLFQQQQYAAGATEFFSYIAPIVPLTCITNVFISLVMGMVLLKELIVITISTNLFYLVSLLLLLRFSEDTIMAIGIANALFTLVTFGAYVAVFNTKSFKSKYIITDFSYILSYWRKNPEEKGLLNDDEREKDGTKKIKQLGKATVLVLLKNLASTVASVASVALLSAKLPTNQFVANNVVQNTLQLSPFGAYFATLLTMFGPRFIMGCDKKSYMSTMFKAHVNIALAAVGSLLAIFAFHTADMSLHQLTSPDNRAEVIEILIPIWPIWIIGLILKMYETLYTTTLVNFEKYTILAVTSMLTSLGTLPLIILYAFKFHSLLGFYLAPVITSAINLVVGATIFHLKLLKDPKWQVKEQALVEITIWIDKLTFFSN